MFKIFRKIRKRLLAKNEISKYLAYAIGEIILVVIGILIALQINNWNQAKKDQRALNEYLIKIKSHTYEDLAQLEEITAGRKLILESCKKARISILDKTEEENLFLFLGSGAAFAEYYFKPNSGGYESLKNSQYFGKINNTPLDSLLARYHGLVEIIAENEKNYNEYTISQEAYISTQFDRSLILAAAFMPQDSLALRATPQSEYIEAYKAYISTPVYRNVISLAAFQFETMIDQYDQLSVLGNNVIKEIDKVTE